MEIHEIGYLLNRISDEIDSLKRVNKEEFNGMSEFDILFKLIEDRIELEENK